MVWKRGTPSIHKNCKYTRMVSQLCSYWYWIVIHFVALNNEKKCMCNYKQNKKDAKDTKARFYSSVLTERKHTR